MKTGKGGKKRPGIVRPPPPTTKTPRADPLEQPDKWHPAWNFRSMDFEGEWGWSVCSGDQLRSIHNRLKSYETMTWGEIKKNDKTGSHPIDIEKLCADARKRLEALFKDDLAELMSLRITGRQRMWGIMDHHIFRVLWWDPEHTVYPVELQNT